MKVQLTLTEDQQNTLYQHLFPGDGLEAVAFLVCGHAKGDERHRLVVKKVFTIPYENCERNKNYVSWNADDIQEILDAAEIDGSSLIKVHSHPQGYARFSEVDDASDAQLLPTIRSWIEADIPHASAVMLPDKTLIARYLWKDDILREFDGINVVGSSLD